MRRRDARHVRHQRVKYADIVVLEGGHNLVALEMIMQRIQNHIDGE